MDLKAYVSLFRTQSEHLRVLAEHLATQFAQIEQGLQDRALNTEVEARPQIDGLIQGSALVSKTADILHQRLVAFSKKIQRENDFSLELPVSCTQTALVPAA